MMRRISFVFALAGLCTSTVFAGTITFDGFVHGRIINNQVAGVTISAVNVGGGPNIAAVFDTNQLGTADPDLQFNDPIGERVGWADGNLPSLTDLGGVLFIAEHSASTGGVLNDPDDEGSRPAGDLIFEFVSPISSFGFDLVDVEDVTNELGSVEFFGMGMGASFLSVSFADFLSLSDPAIFGDASANRIPAIALGQNASKVVIHMGGSGAVDNITFSTPEPGTLLLLGTGLLGMAAVARRRRR